MASSYTPLLGFVLPVTGELSGSWGSVWNDSGTSLLDSAISGTTSITADADITLTTTTGTANQARQAIILWNPASGTATRNITAPAQSKIYTVINASGGTQSIVFRGAGPTTGVTIIKGESAVVAWNGTDFIKISNTGGGGSFTNVAISGTTTLSGLTASTALALNASKEVVSVTNTGTGNNVLATSPTLVTPTLGTPTSVTLTNATGLPISTGVSGLGTGVATALAVNVGTAGAPVVNGGVLGTPSSGTVTNLTGTASININGTVGATTPNTGAFTTLTTSSTVTLNGGTANGVTYLNGSKVLTTGSALTFDGTTLTAARYQSTSSNAALPSYGVEAGSGIFNAGASTIGFSTGSTEQMRLTSTGLGIGTSSPGAKLDVTGSAVNVAKFQNGSNQPVFVVSASNLSGILAESANQNGWLMNSASNYVVAYTNGAEKMRLDSSGNLGLGVTPSAWYAGYTAFEFGGYGSLTSRAATNDTELSSNAYRNASATYIYKKNGTAQTFDMANGLFAWNTAPSGTAGNAISFTQAMTLDASGNLGVGTTSPISKLHVFKSSGNQLQLQCDNTGTVSIDMGGTTTPAKGGIGFSDNADALFFRTNSTERARIDSSGNLLVGTTTSTARLTTASAGAQGAVEVSFLAGGCQFFVNSGGAANAAATVQRLGHNTTTSRSINAGGTINASGADYAEYMTKAGDFTVAKGDVVGIDAQGKLTNVFSNAVSFCVKSTDPSYVGGDTWGIDFEGDAEGLEAARQTVDRIAFAGQVPVNVIGATAGQYIIPVNDNGAIKGDAVSSPTFEQYQQAVGKVIAIEADGRARIIVKVA